MGRNTGSAPTRIAVAWLALGSAFAPSLVTLFLQLCGVRLHAMGNLRNSIIVCNSLCVLLGLSLQRSRTAKRLYGTGHWPGWLYCSPATQRSSCSLRQRLWLPTSSFSSGDGIMR